MKFILEYSEYQEDKPIISIIQEEDIEGCLDVMQECFGHLDSRDTMRTRLKPRFTNGISIKLKYNNEIVGVYLVAEKSLKQFLISVKTGGDEVKNRPKEAMDNPIFHLDEADVSDNGIQGISLCVKSDHRNKGFGNLLKEKIRNVKNYEYLWGVSHKKLGNIEHWLKTRELVLETDNVYVTWEKI